MFACIRAHREIGHEWCFKMNGRQHHLCMSIGRTVGIACLLFLPGVARAETIRVQVISTRARPLAPQTLFQSNKTSNHIVCSDAAGKFFVRCLTGQSSPVPYNPNDHSSSLSFELEIYSLPEKNIAGTGSAYSRFGPGPRRVGQSDCFEFEVPPGGYVIHGIIPFQEESEIELLLDDFDEQFYMIGGVPSLPVEGRGIRPAYREFYEAIRSMYDMHVGDFVAGTNARLEPDVFEIIGVAPVTQWKTTTPSSLSPGPRISSIVFKIRKTLFAHNSIYTHVAQREAPDHALLILPDNPEDIILPQQAADPDPIRNTVEVLLEEGIDKGIDKGVDRYVLSPMLGNFIKKFPMGTLVLAGAKDILFDPGSLITIDTGIDLLSSAVLTAVCPALGSRVVWSVFVAVAPPIAVGFVEKAVLDSYSRSDDLEIERTGEKLIVRNLGIPLYNAAVFRMRLLPPEYYPEHLPCSEAMDIGHNEEGIFDVDGLEVDEQAAGVYSLRYRSQPFRGLMLNGVTPLNALHSGKLDVVFCIDVSGSMGDDIDAVKANADELIRGFRQRAEEQSISLQLGLVTFTRHTDPDWFSVWPLTDRLDSMRDTILGIQIRSTAAGAGGNEDTYAALMYAINEKVGESGPIEMGWRGPGDGANKGLAAFARNPAGTGAPVLIGDRQGAAKVIITMGDEPQDDPDDFGHTLARVAQVAEDLDPVHVYPVVLPKEAGMSLLSAAVAAKRRLAEATDGRLIKVADAADLPAAILSTLDLAIRRHRAEIWRKDHPPYLMYGVGAVTGLVVFVSLAFLIAKQMRRGAPGVVAPPSGGDPRLTGKPHRLDG